MKKFDFELVKQGRGVVTTTGVVVKILDTNRKVTGPIVAAVGTDEVLYVFDKDGKSVGGLLQLQMIPQTQTRYFNIYTNKGTGEMIVGECSSTLDQSIKWATKPNHNLKFIRREILEITL